MLECVFDFRLEFSWHRGRVLSQHLKYIDAEKVLGGVFL